MKKNLVLTLLLGLAAQFSFAQVQGVNYAIKYNAKSCLFDCFMVVNEGHAKNTLDRAQFNAQLTIIAPVTSNVYITESYMPLVNNQNRDGNTPANWQVANEIESPKDMPDNRLVSIIPEILPTAFYNNLNVGQEVKLFSFKVTPLTHCGNEVRLYDNIDDPKSSREGMYGSDFRNGFTIGGIEQKYQGNSEMVYPNAPVIEDVQFSMGSTEINLDITASQDLASECQKGMYFEVYGPQGLIGDKATFLKMKRKGIVKGEYKVVATDNLGCKSESTFYPYGNSTSVSTEEELAVTAFESEIYPVPAQNEISLTVNGVAGSKVVGKIYDLQGKEVRTNIINVTLNGGEETFSYETNLSPGMYNIVLTVDNKDAMNHKLLIIK